MTAITIDNSASASTTAPAIDPKGTAPMVEDPKTSKDYYFDSYAHFGIHEV